MLHAFQGLYAISRIFLCTFAHFLVLNMFKNYSKKIIDFIKNDSLVQIYEKTISQQIKIYSKKEVSY